MTFFAQDKVGNVSKLLSQAVKVDTVAPVTAVQLSGRNSSAGYIGPVQITLTATDNLSGVRTIRYALDGGSPADYSAPVTVSGLGSHTLTFFSFDNASNTEAGQTATFRVLAATVTKLTASSTSATVGTTITLVAKVVQATGPVPAGRVVFMHGRSSLGNAPLNASGVAQLKTAALPKGADSVVATYQGSTTDAASTSAAVVITMQ